MLQYDPRCLGASGPPDRPTQAIAVQGFARLSVRTFSGFQRVETIGAVSIVERLKACGNVGLC
jgi:hypothetical protein